MARKVNSLFNDGIVDIHYINPDKPFAEENAALYEDRIYEAINYIEKNHVSEVWLHNEVFLFDEVSEKTYNKSIKEILNILNGYALSLS